MRRTIEAVLQEGYEVGNVDIPIALQRPKLRPYIDQMRERLAEVMGVEVGAVSVKATTTEKLGFEGRGEGVSAYAVVLLNGNILEKTLLS
jgi:2-C-methyl-D-erythritol 2,4-cyclodiphosphate synthase